MRLPRRILFTAAALLVAFFLTPSAQAIALYNRVFMSTGGNDGNNCANPVTPCYSFAGALAQVEAGGEVIAETTGGYGAINITQSVTVSGPAGVVIFSGYPVNVNASGATVVLRGLTIDGTGATTGSGINVVAVGVLHVESCVITGFAGTTGTDGYGILFKSSGQLFVKDTIIRGNAEIGIWVIPSSGTVHASIDRCRLEQNGWGLQADASSYVTIGDSVASGNAPGSGLIVANGGELNAERCLVANNSNVGLFSTTTGSTLRASNCTVTDNGTGLSAGGFLLSRSNNTVEGNGTNGSFSGTYSAK